MTFVRLPGFILMFCEFSRSVLSSLVCIILSQYDSEAKIPSLLLFYAALSEATTASGRLLALKTANQKKNKCGSWKDSGGALPAFNLLA